MKKVFYLLTLVLGLSLTLTACGGDDKDDEPQVKFKDVTLKFEETYTIPNGKNVTWTSSNQYIASVDGDVITAERVGEAIISSDKGTFKVTVEPTTYVFDEPCLTWGASAITVKSFMSSKISTCSLVEEDAESLAFANSTKSKVYLYGLENGQLHSSSVGILATYVSAEAMVQSLIERYVPVDKYSDMYFFLTPDKKNLLAFSLTGSGKNMLYFLYYVENTTSSRSFEVPAEILEKYNIKSTAETRQVFPELEAKLKF